MHYFVVNPASRSGRGRQKWATVENYLKENKIEYHVFFTSRTETASALVSQIMTRNQISSVPIHQDVSKPENDPSSNSIPKNPISLFILGGDGTLNEAINGITDFSKVVIGYIPTGSSNDFARAIGYEQDTLQLIDHMLTNPDRKTIDLGRITSYSNAGSHPFVSTDHSHVSTDHTNSQDCADRPHSRYFAVSCGIGYDAAVCEEALNSPVKDVLNRLGLGKLTYAGIALKQLITLKKQSMKILFPEIHKQKSLDRAFFVSVHNCPYEGGGLMLCPAADPSDGKLNVCAVGDRSKAFLACVLPTAYIGRHTHFRAVHLYTTSGLRIVTDRPLTVHTDGEMFGPQTHIMVESVPGILNIIM